MLRLANKPMEIQMPKRKAPLPIFCVRQGDVLLVDATYRSNGIPASASRRKPEPRGVVLMHGEVTGHAHVLEADKVRYFDAAAERFLQIVAPVGLKHEEHGTIMLDAGGRLQQAFQVEDFGEEVRHVAD